MIISTDIPTQSAKPEEHGTLEHQVPPYVR